LEILSIARLINLLLIGSKIKIRTKKGIIILVSRIKNDPEILYLCIFDIEFFNFEDLGWSEIINNTSSTIQ
jgi:hypothetical protein